MGNRVAVCAFCACVCVFVHVCVCVCLSARARGGVRSAGCVNRIKNSVMKGRLLYPPLIPTKKPPNGPLFVPSHYRLVYLKTLIGFLVLGIGAEDVDAARSRLPIVAEPHNSGAIRFPIAKWPMDSSIIPLIRVGTESEPVRTHRGIKACEGIAAKKGSGQ